jgi:hypothetical protein
MMMPPRPTEKFILAQIEFFQSGFEYYRAHCQGALASWSKLKADVWRAKLPQPVGREAGDGE